MSDKISITLDSEPSILGDKVKCTIRFHEADMVGCDAEIKVTTSVKVNDKSPVNEIKTSITKIIKIDTAKIDFDIPAKLINHYSYTGFEIDIVSEFHIVVDDALFFDSKLTIPITRQIIKKPVIMDQAGALSAPHDEKRFFTNLFALPVQKRKKVIRTLLIGYSIFFTVVFFALHDLWVGRKLAYLYTFFPDGSSERIFLIPLISIITSVFSLGITHLLVNNHLSSWLKVSLNKRRQPRSIESDGVCRVSDLIRGKTSINVDRIKVRIVACNLECGEYSRSDGSTTRIVSFSRPVREFILFEKTIQNITKGIPVETYLNDTFSFKPMYKNLYPENMLSSSHGIDLHWEVQFLHDDFIDHEVKLPTHQFIDAAFYK